MTELGGPTAESHDPLKMEDQSKLLGGKPGSQELRAGLGAISTAVIGIILVVVLQKIGISDSATIVTLLLVPLLVYGIVSGRLSELTGPGGWGAKFNELKKDFEETKSQVERQQASVTKAEGAAESAAQLANLATVPRETKSLVTANPEEELNDLIAEYNNIRENQRSGSDRTANMTKVVRKMIDLSPELVQFDVPGYLVSDNRGQRLAAYSYLLARPQQQFLAELVDSVTNREDKPFGQYWGLQAISRNLPHRDQQTIPPEVMKSLKSFGLRLSRGSDRDFVLRTILREIESGGRVAD